MFFDGGITEEKALSGTIQQKQETQTGTKTEVQSGSNIENIKDEQQQEKEKPELEMEVTASFTSRPVMMNNPAMRASGTTQTENSVARVEMNGQTTYYESLDEAVETVSNINGTAIITLLKDGSLTKFSASFIRGNITLIGGAYTIQVGGGGVGIRGNLTIDGGNFIGDILYIFANGTLNMKGGTIASIDNSLGGGGTVNIYGGSIQNIKGENVTYHVSSISLTPDNLNLTIGASQTLQAAVLPTISASHVSVTWLSSDKNVATVDNGKVAAVAPGEVTITASADGKSATCTVKVNKGSTTINNKDGNGYPTTFTNGDNLPTPSADYFDITGSQDGFAYQWYKGDHTTGELTGGFTKNPKNVGSYTLVVTTKETSTYSGGEKRLLVTINPAEYTVTIPSNATAGGDEVSLTPSDFKIGQIGQGRVTVSGGVEEGKVTLTRQETGTENAVQITSQLLNGENGTGLSNESAVAVYGLDGDGSVALQQGTTGKLYFAAPTETNIAAGTYLGTVTFQISYEIAQN